MNKREAILAFLKENAAPEMAAKFHLDLEVQVLTACDDGIPFWSEYKGTKWRGYHAPDTQCVLGKDGSHEAAKGCEFWKDYRIPWNANAEPKYEDSRQVWEIGDHAFGIGCTGWNWVTRKSEWFGYDFDSVANHANYGRALTDQQMAAVLTSVSQVPWVEVRRSKSGRGHHLFVTLEEPYETANHTEHAALARSILHLLSALTGEQLASSVDCVGGNLWLWHRDTGPGAWGLVKSAQPFPSDLVPQDWSRHLSVTRGKRKRALTLAPSGTEEDVEDVTRRTSAVPLDDEHKRLLGWHAERNVSIDWAWDPDYHMLRTHTAALAEAHTDLGLQGVFYTDSQGHDLLTGNCFAFPCRDGAWEVRRHGKGCDEHPAWTTDAGGWTRCMFNVPATLEQVCLAQGGTLDSSNVWHFDHLKGAVDALRDLGHLIEAVEVYESRQANLSVIKGGKLALRFDRVSDEEKVPRGWVKTSKGRRKQWERVLTHTDPPTQAEVPDDIVRAVVMNGTFQSFYVWAGGTWVAHPSSNAEKVLLSHGVASAEAKAHMGMAVLNAWQEVNEPFGDEYPGNRRWNRRGARLAKVPEEGEHSYWDLMLEHLGHGLTEGVKEHPWCQRHGLKTGADYLKLWCASLFQHPRDRLPYLFFFSPQQGTGKSLFHEALSIFFENGRGYAQAKVALTSNFNASLAGAILCVVEEVDLRKDKGAYHKIKDWTTSPVLNIHAKGRDDYDGPNYTHWVQCANSAGHCPIEMGDTRIVMVKVNPFKGDEIPKHEFLQKLEEEAPAFLNTLLTVNVPPTPERLRIPAVVTDVKEAQEEASMDEFALFLRDVVVAAPGYLIKWTDFVDVFKESLDAARRPYWTQGRIWKRLAAEGNHFVKGKYGREGAMFLGNARWLDPVGKPKQRKKSKLIKINDKGRLA